MTGRNRLARGAVALPAAQAEFVRQAVARSEAGEIEQPSSEAAGDGRRTWWDWARHWEFWLAVALGAFLRLWHLDVSGFLRDQVGYMTLARAALRLYAAPIAALPLSIGVFGQPLDVYLAMPFAALSTNPLPVIVSIAVWNVAGVALCYIWTLRMFGRPVAATATLMLATCQATVHFSTFLWPPNYIAPLAALWALTLFAIVRGRRRWLPANMVLVALITMLHPVGILLAAVVAVAVALAPVRPRLRDYVTGFGICALLEAPTLVFEIISGGWDVRILSRMGGQPASADLRVVYMLYQLLGGSAYAGPDAQSPYALVDSATLYAALRPVTGAIELGLTLLFFASYLALTVRVLARGEWHIREAHTLGQGDPRGWWARTVRRMRADTQWKDTLLLWLWITLPLAALLRHSSPIYIQYLFVLYPAVFVVCALGMRWAVDACIALTRSRSLRTRPSAAWLTAVGAPALMVALVGVLTLGQTAQTVAYTAALAQGRFEALAGYGYPVGTLLSADRALAALQRQQHATSLLISTPLDYYRDELDYLLVGEQADRAGFYGDCLLLPAPNAGPALAVATSPLGRAAELLHTLPNARHLTDIPTTGHAPPFAVYRVEGTPPQLTGEQRLAPVTFRTAQGQGLRLEGAKEEAGGILRLRWTVLASTRAGQPAPTYQIQVRPAGSIEGAGGTPLTGQCAATHWRAGETLFTWVTPPAGRAPHIGSASTTGVDAFSVEVYAQAHSLWVPTIGPVRMLTDVDAGGPPILLARSAG